ncbi:RhoGAP-domain-containing protein, partial [Aureobasidium melanogenum]
MDVATLRSQLRRAQQKIAELEADKLGLEEKMDTSADIKHANTELREKRSTMAFLDTQREMVVRELEIMTEHLTRAKESNKPLDISQLKSEILQDFAHSLQKLKDNLGSQIEDLVHKRNELTDDISNLIQVKDKGLQEFESLSSKNLQLAELNNQLVSGIQDLYKSQNSKSGGIERSPLTNGLGIYNGSNRGDMTSLHSASLQESTSLHDLLPHAADAEPATVLTAPQVVNIRKGQPKKFNWKKGSSGLAKNVTKGLKGAFAGNNDRGVPVKADGSYDITGMPYSQMQAGPGAIMGDQPLNRAGDAKSFGFFSSNQKNGLKPGAHGKNSSSSNLLAENPSVLFGSDLRERCDYEKRVLPSIVTHCVEEVEKRGMDTEGIYRKSGGSGQVKLIQQGFEKDGAYDISDPDLDIHAVTSALKQYFRKLPNPLITYEAYDPLLEAAQITEKEKQVPAIKAALEAMPQAHHDVLEYLVQHLCRVVKQESENLMTPLNLSVVFAPTILRPLSIEREMSDMQAQRMAVQALLEHA